MKSLRDFESKKEYEEYLRIHFAAMAMQGFLAGFPNHMASGSDIAPYAVEQADALMAELNKKK